MKLFFQTAHTHLQQPDVTWSQSWDSEKHVGASHDCLPVWSGMSLMPDNTPRTGNPLTGGLSGCVLGHFNLCSAIWCRTVWSALIMSPSCLYITGSLQAVCLRGITGGGTQGQRSQTKQREGWMECRAEWYLNIKACQLLVELYWNMCYCFT